MQEINLRTHRLDTPRSTRVDEVQRLAQRTENLRPDTLKNSEDEIMSRNAAESLKQISTDAEGYIAAFRNFIGRTIGFQKQETEIPLDEVPVQRVRRGPDYMRAINRGRETQETAESKLNNKTRMKLRTQAAMQSHEYDGYDDPVDRYYELPRIGKAVLENYAERYVSHAFDKPILDQVDYFDHEDNLPSVEEIQEDYPGYTEEERKQLLGTLRTYKFPDKNAGDKANRESLEYQEKRTLKGENNKINIEGSSSIAFDDMLKEIGEEMPQTSPYSFKWEELQKLWDQEPDQNELK